MSMKSGQNGSSGPNSKSQSLPITMISGYSTTNAFLLDLLFSSTPDPSSTQGSFLEFPSSHAVKNMELYGGESVSGSPGGQSALDHRNEVLANVEIGVLGLILVLAVFGNGVMLLALRRQLEFRPMSRMYFFMLNLSIADLLVALGNILPQLVWDITYRFQGPDLLCRVVKFLQVFVLYLSTFVLTSMAVDRYMVVCHHTFSRNHYVGFRGPKALVIISWILAILFSTPQVYLFGMKEVKSGSGVMDCWVHFPEPWGAQAYVTWFVVSIFFFPLLIIGLSYGAICIKVIRFHLPLEPKSESKLSVLNNGTPSSESRPKMSRRQQLQRKHHSFSSSSRTETESEVTPSGGDMTALQQGQGATTGHESKKGLKRQISQAKIKTLKLTLVIVICFFVCWAPFCFTQLLMVYNPPESDELVGPIRVILLLLASLNACTNPWIYLAFSETLLNQLRMFLGIGLARGSDEPSIGDDHEALPHHPGGGNPGTWKNPPELVRALPGMMGRKAETSIDQNEQGYPAQPQTKSEIL